MSQQIHKTHNYLANRGAFGGKTNRNACYRVVKFLDGINDHNAQLGDEVEAKNKARIDKILEQFPWKEEE